MPIQTEEQNRGALRRFGNSLISVRLSAADGGDGISVVEQWLPHGEAPPRHLHRRQDEVFVVLEGTVRMVVGETDRLAAAGDTVLAPKGVPHAFRVESEGGAHCLVITRGGDFEAMIGGASHPTADVALPDPIPPSPEAIAALDRLCRDNHIEIVGPPLG